METATVTKQNQGKKYGPLYFEYRTREGQKRYFNYRNRLIESGIVSPLAVQIWEKFVDILRQRARFSNKNIHFPSVSKLSDHFKKSVPTITKAINELIDQELITREIGKGGRGNYEKTSKYQLLNHPCFHGDFTKKTIIKGKELLYPLWTGKGKRNFTKEYKDLLERVKRNFKKGKKRLYGFIDGNVIQLSETTDGFHDVENPEYCFSIALVKNRKERKPSPSFSENPKDLKGENPLKNPPLVEGESNQGIKNQPENQEFSPDKEKGNPASPFDAVDPLKDWPKEVPTLCPKCNSKVVQRTGQYGLFYHCSSWRKDGTGCTWKYKARPRHIQAMHNEDWFQGWMDQLPDD